MDDWRRYVRENLQLSRAAPEREADAIDEIARQLEDAYLEAVSLGLSPEEAERQAKLHVPDWNGLSEELCRNARYRDFRNDALQKERTQNMGAMGWVDSLGRDVRYATRKLSKTPG